MLKKYSQKGRKTGWVGFQLFGEPEIHYMFFGNILDDLDLQGLKLMLIEKVEPASLMTYDIESMGIVRHIDPPVDVVEQMLEYFKTSEKPDSQLAIDILEKQLKEFKD